VLVVDETGFLKKGDKSVGVQRQYTGTAGRIENSQVGVFLALSGSQGRALVDRELYLPKGWCDDPSRCREAKVPEGTKFATKPQLAQRMLSRAFEGGLSPEWVLADEAYGNDSKFRQFLEDRNRCYVVAISSNHLFWDGEQRKRIDSLANEMAPDQWIQLSVGDGSKGPREYDWAVRSIGKPTESGLQRIALFRRSIENPEELAYYQRLAPANATIQDLATAAGQRWSIECCFEAAKQETGLVEYEVRSWHGWYRHITLSMLALVFLTVVRAKANEDESVKKKIRR
jgi:SRSO17 transposase